MEALPSLRFKVALSQCWLEQQHDLWPGSSASALPVPSNILQEANLIHKARLLAWCTFLLACMHEPNKSTASGNPYMNKCMQIGCSNTMLDEIYNIVSQTCFKGASTHLIADNPQHGQSCNLQIKEAQAGGSFYCMLVVLH